MKVLGYQISIDRPNQCYDWTHIFNEYTKLAKKNHLVLEIGSSNPSRTKALCKLCRNLIGIELYQERIPHSYDNVEYRQGDWQELTKVVKKNSVDLCVASHVIEHVHDDLKALNELHQVLKPGGIALINTPNRKRLTRYIIEVFTGERKFPYWEHCREYVENDIQNLIKSSRFKKGRVTPVSFGINGGPLFIYLHSAPKIFRKYANFWEIRLVKK